MVEGKGRTLKTSDTIAATHYIAAEETVWDYTPLGKEGCNGTEFGSDEKVFTAAGDYRPGSKYIKALYREYEDINFQTRKPLDTDLNGVSGPLLHFEVGEIVEIVFYNKASFSCNIHVIGLQLLGMTLQENEVSPGAQTTYIFRVPRETGPGRRDLSSIAYVYYSSVDQVGHTAAGLVGVVAIAKKGVLDPQNRTPKGIRTLPWLMNIFRENESPLILESIKKFATNGNTASENGLNAISEDEAWIESNAMHSVNGYLFSSVMKLPQFSFEQTVRFYVFGFGSEASLHGPEWYGQTIKGKSLRGNDGSGVQILPFNAETVDVYMSSLAQWTFVCEVSDHVLAGMKMCFNVS